MNNNIKSLNAAGSDVQLLISLLKFSSLISKPMKENVADVHGVNRNELKVLICLSGEGALTGQEISRLMAMPAMNVSRSLSQLAEIGWIEPADNSENRRRRPYRISAKGWRDYGAMLPDLRSVAMRLLAPLSRKDRVELQRLIGLMIHEIEEWSAEASTLAREQ